MGAQSQGASDALAAGSGAGGRLASRGRALASPRTRPPEPRGVGCGASSPGREQKFLDLLVKEMSLEAVASTQSDFLIPGLSYNLGQTASYVTGRRFASVTALGTDA
jgi:hypothetical protein